MCRSVMAQEQGLLNPIHIDQGRRTLDRAPRIMVLRLGPWTFSVGLVDLLRWGFVC